MTEQRFNGQGQLLCNGTSKRTGQPCKAVAMANGKCYFHGGASLKGVESGTYKHGRFSIDLPDRLAERYHQALADPDWVELWNEGALLDVNIAEMLKKLDTGESGAAWAEAQQTMGRLQSAYDDADPARLSRELRRMDRILNRGAVEYALWGEIRAAVDAKRKIAESQRKRMVETEQFISVGQLALAMGIIKDLIRTHVTDDNARRSIAVGIDQFLLGGNSSNTP